MNEEMGMSLEKLGSGAVKRVKKTEDSSVKQESQEDVNEKIKEKLAAEIKVFQESRESVYPYAEKGKTKGLEAEKKEFYKKRAAEKINN